MNRDRRGKPHLRCGSLFHVREKAIQRLGERGVGEDGVAESRVGHVTHHGYLDHRHNLASLYPEHGATQDLIVLGVDDGLHEAARLARLYGPVDVVHWEPGYERVAPLVPDLLFAQADPA